MVTIGYRVTQVYAYPRETHSETVEVILMTDQIVPLPLVVRLHDVAVVCVDEDHNVLQFTHENVKHNTVVCGDEDHSVKLYKVVCVDEDHNVLQFTHENMKHNTVVHVDEDQCEALQSRRRRVIYT